MLKNHINLKKYLGIEYTLPVAFLLGWFSLGVHMLGSPFGLVKEIKENERQMEFTIMNSDLNHISIIKQIHLIRGNYSDSDIVEDPMFNSIKQEYNFSDSELLESSNKYHELSIKSYDAQRKGDINKFNRFRASRDSLVASLVD